VALVLIPPQLVNTDKLIPLRQELWNQALNGLSDIGTATPTIMQDDN
jgi:hypothetical protein